MSDVDRHQELADAHTPRHIKSVAHYFHSLTEIWEFYRSRGSDPPLQFMAEMRRAEDVFMKTLDEETSQGGVLHAYYKEKK